MRKIVTYLLLISFVFQSASQLWIFASFYTQRDYIANSLGLNRLNPLSDCKGKCFLVTELKENEKKQAQQFPDLKQKEIQLFEPIGLIFNSTPIYRPLSEKISGVEPSFILSGFILSIFHPPRHLV
jgi:hypothetical protein